MTFRIARDALLLFALALVAVLAGVELERNQALEIKIVTLSAEKDTATTMLQECASLLPSGSEDKGSPL